MRLTLALLLLTVSLTSGCAPLVLAGAGATAAVVADNEKEEQGGNLF